MDVNPRRGEIWLTKLSPVEGSEQGGTRPFLIIQVDVLNELSPVTIGFSLSSKTEKVGVINVSLSAQDTDIKKEGMVLTNQIRTIAKSRLIKKLARITPEVLQRVEAAFLAVVGIRTS